MTERQLELISNLVVCIECANRFNRSRTKELFDFLEFLKSCSLLEWKEGAPTREDMDVLLELTDGQIHKAETAWESADEYGPGFVFIDCTTYEITDYKDIKRWAEIP